MNKYYLFQLIDKKEAYFWWLKLADLKWETNILI